MSYVKAFNPFWVNFCDWCKLWAQFHSFPCEYSIIPAPFIEEKISSCQVLVDHICLALFLGYWFSSWIIDSVLLIYLSLFRPLLYCSDDYSFTVQLKIKICNLSWLEPLILIILIFFLSDKKEISLAIWSLCSSI